MKKIELSDYRRFALEFIIIVAGVLVALAVDDWRQARSNLATEQYILEGLLADLQRDRDDIESSIRVASARAAGADKLLVEIGNAAAGRVQLTTWAGSLTGLLVPAHLDEHQAFENARQQFPSDSLSVTSALRMLTAVPSMQRINVSAVAFNEASATGTLDILRDVTLRGDLAQYYFSASRFGGTTDQRVDENWLHLRNALASRGLPPDGATSDEEILGTLRADDALVAEIINAREFAVSQIILNTSVFDDANSLAMSVEEALRRD